MKLAHHSMGPTDTLSLKIEEGFQMCLDSKSASSDAFKNTHDLTSTKDNQDY